MLAESRRAAIVDLLRSAGSVTVGELEERFGISSMTARRDLADLERQGLARRTHGGAVLPAISAHEDSFVARVETRAGGQAGARAGRRRDARPAPERLPGLLVDRVLRRPAHPRGGPAADDHHQQPPGHGAGRHEREPERRAHRRGRLAAPPDAVLRRPVRRPHRARALRRPPLPVGQGRHPRRRAHRRRPARGRGQGDDDRARRRGLPADRRLQAPGARPERHRPRRRPGRRLRLRGEARARWPRCAPPAPTSAPSSEVGHERRRRPRSSRCATPSKSYGAVRARARRARIALRPGEVRAPGRRERRRQVDASSAAGRRHAAATPAASCVDGEPVDFHGPADARDAGIAVIYQEPTLFPDLSVAENVMMGRQPLSARPPDRPARPARRRSRACSTASASGSTPTGRCAASRSPTSRSSRSPRR